VLCAAREIVARHPGETAVAFTHSVPIRVILTDALSMPLDAMFRLELDYGGISVVDSFDGRLAVRALNLGSLL
jgi:broad specificity phosphatase PhoE